MSGSELALLQGWRVAGGFLLLWGVALTSRARVEVEWGGPELASLVARLAGLVLSGTGVYLILAA